MVSHVVVKKNYFKIESHCFMGRLAHNVLNIKNVVFKTSA
jgi:hypothetical protein